MHKIIKYLEPCHGSASEMIFVSGGTLNSTHALVVAIGKDSEEFCYSMSSPVVCIGQQALTRLLTCYPCLKSYIDGSNCNLLIVIKVSLIIVSSDSFP